MGPVARRRACLSGRVGVRRRVGHVQLRGCVCVWAWRGGVARRKMRAASVPLRPSGAASCPPATSAGQPTVCVWRTLRGVQLARQGWERGGWREGSPHATRRGRRWATACAAPCACVRRAGRGRALEPKRCASKRNRKFADGGLPADKKIEQLVFQSQARRKAGRGAGGRASRLGTPGPSRSASAARLARLVKKRKRRPPEGHRQPRRRTGCTPETHSSHALQNDTPRPEPAPAGMLQGLPIAAARRAAASSG